MGFLLEAAVCMRFAACHVAAGFSVGAEARSNYPRVIMKSIVRVHLYACSNFLLDGIGTLVRKPFYRVICLFSLKGAFHNFYSAKPSKFPVILTIGFLVVVI